MVTGVISFCPRPTVHRLGLNPGLLGIDRLLLKISQLCCVQFTSFHSATGHRSPQSAVSVASAVTACGESWLIVLRGHYGAGQASRHASRVWPYSELMEGTTIRKCTFSVK